MTSYIRPAPHNWLFGVFNFTEPPHKNRTKQPITDAGAVDEPRHGKSQNVTPALEVP